MSKRPSFLADASKAIRPGFATAIVFSFFVNLLAFVGPLYMLQVYDRVLGSRNIGTLVALTIIASFLLIVYAALEKIRSSILVRLGLLFADKAKSPLFDTVLRGTIVQPGTNQAQALRDLDTIREFLTGTGLIAFLRRALGSCVRRRMFHHASLVRLRGRRGGIAHFCVSVGQRAIDA